MIRYVLAFWAFAFALVPATAESDPTLHQFRSLLDAGDYNGLEAAASELLSSDSKDSISTYRDVARTLFRTTHPQRLATIDAWLAAHPRSTHAITASAWAAIHKGYAAGLFEFTGASAGSYSGAGEKASELRELRQRAIRLSVRAVQSDPWNVGAIDAWMHTSTWTGPSAFSGLYARRLLDLAPNRESILIIMTAHAGVRTADVERTLIGICLHYAERIHSYDQERCIIDVAYSFMSARDLKLAAADALRTLEDDPRFDYARIEEALYPTKEVGPDGSMNAFPYELARDDIDRLRDWQLSNLHARRDPSQFLLHARRIAGILEIPEYATEMEDRYLAATESWLKDDPYYPLHLEKVMEIQLRRGNVDQARSAFLALLRNAWHEQSTWERGAQIELSRSQPDLNVAVDLIETAASAGGNDLHSMLSNHLTLEAGLADLEHDAPGMERAICMKVRLARLAGALCELTDVGQFACSGDTPMLSSLEKTLESTDKGLCNDVRQKRLSDLRFTTVGLRSRAADILSLSE